MAKVNKWITARKAVFTLLKIAVVAGGSITATQISQLEGGGEVAVVAGMGIIGAVLRAWNNVRKQSERPAVEYHTRGLLLILIPMLALGGMVSGCETIMGGDGTITYRVDVDAEDVSTAWAVYEAVQAERARLEAERREADAAERARLDAQLRALAEAADRAYQRWLDAGGHL